MILNSDGEIIYIIINRNWSAFYNIVDAEQEVGGR
jgi:hypothetical protein